MVSIMDYSGSLMVTNPQNITPSNYYFTYGSSAPGWAYYTLSGTSMATPVVSAAAALLIQKTPSMTPDQVKARLMKNATKNFPASSVAVDPVTNVAYTSYYDLFTVGAGYIDIAAALADTTSRWTRWARPPARWWCRQWAGSRGSARARSCKSPSVR